MNLLRFFCIVSLNFLFFNLAGAGTIQQVKGKNAIANFEGSEISPKVDAVYTIVENGKVVGKFKVKTIKGKKALGIIAGKVSEGSVLTEGGASASGADSAATSAGSKSRSGLFNNTTWGIQFGYVMGAQSVSGTAATTGAYSTAMTGGGFALKAFWDMPVMGNLRVHVRPGYEQLAVKGTLTAALSGNGSSVNTSINYLTGDVLARYHFGSGGFVPFASAGAFIYYPISSTTNILDTSKIGLTTIFAGDLGFNLAFSQSYISTSLEYGMYPPSNDVKTSHMAIRIGYGWKW